MYFENAYEITAERLRALVAGKVFERQTLEYKRQIHGDESSEIREFLADVSSFANSAGGDIIYGVVEEDGIPLRLCGAGIEDENIDGAILRLDSQIRDGIEPRIPDVRIMPVSLRTGAWCVVIHVPPSRHAPHRVIFRDHGHFYARDKCGRYRMNVDQLRDQFLRNAGPLREYSTGARTGSSDFLDGKEKNRTGN